MNNIVMNEIIDTFSRNELLAVEYFTRKASNNDPITELINEEEAKNTILKMKAFQQSVVYYLIGEATVVDFIEYGNKDD